MELKALDTGTHNTLLSWMIECADESESDPSHLAHLEIVRLSLFIFPLMVMRVGSRKQMLICRSPVPARDCFSLWH